MIRNTDRTTDRKLLSMRPATRLTCVWLPTHDPRAPLTCVWQSARTRKPASPSSRMEERAQPSSASPSSASQGGQRCA
jgi:hypothetical protein